MPAPKDITGKRFSKLLVLAPAGSNRHGKRLWFCVCDCGSFCRKIAGQLLNGRTTSCGCWKWTARAIRQTTHGGTNHPLFNTWLNMKQRCETPTNPSYPNYGGRGIKVCKRWQKFENFLADMGERPDGMTIDRIDNNGDYSPDNCRWATRRQQSRNKRTNQFITFRGKTMIAAEWSKAIGGTPTLISNRLRKGWSAEKAITTPPTLQQKDSA